MNVHKILVGEGAEQFLPFALGKLRSLLATSAQRIIVQKYTLDEATLIIELNPFANQHHIRIEANLGTLGYEFFTTHDSITTFPLPWRATAVRPSPDNQPLRVSKLSAASDTTPPRVIPLDAMARAINGQRNAQYHWWPAKDGAASADLVRTKDWFMTSTMGGLPWQAHDLDFQNYLGSYVTKDGVTAIPHEFTVDVGVDVPITIYEGGKARSALPYPVLPRWPRRAACLTVGGRRFIVATDSHSTFYAFPESFLTSDAVKYAFSAEKGAVVHAAEYMPAGVAVPTVNTMVKRERGVIVESGSAWWYVPEVSPSPILIPYSTLPGAQVEVGADEALQYQRHQYLWDFHPSGERAVAVVHANKNGGATTLKTGGDPVTVLAEYGPQYRIHSANASDEWVMAAGGTTGLEVCEHAVLEVRFKITITGPAESDFTFEVVPERLLQDGWYFDAQYAFCDARLEARGVRGGDLLTDEIRLYGRPPTTGELVVHDSFAVTRNHDTHADVASVCLAWNRPFYMQEGFRNVRMSLGTYPGTPPAIYRWTLYDLMPTGPYGFARLIATDLRSMSKVFHQSTNGTPAGLHALVFGEVRQNAGSSLHTEADSIAKGMQRIPFRWIVSGSPWAAGAFPADDIVGSLPMSLHRIVWEQQVSSYGFDGSVMSAIASHPDGHFAVFCHYHGADFVFDLIEQRTATGFKQTSHTAAYEAAFKVQFDLDAYRAAVATDTPFVMQRFASWRNVKLPKMKAYDYFAINPQIG